MYAFIVLLALLLSALPGAASGGHRLNPHWDTSYGNDHFGRWINDLFGLPAFLYTTDEATDPAAQWTNSTGTHTEFWHQLGNDRVVADAYNHGYVELWDQERQYRWSNQYDASTNHYAGGFGYVNDGQQAWSTLYLDRPPSATYRRVFGMGYYEKDETANGLDLDQTIFAPFGSSPVLLSQVTMTNTRAVTATYTYIEYWDVNPMAVPARYQGTGGTTPQPISATSYDPSSRTLFATPVTTTGTTPHTLFLSSLTDPVAHVETSVARFFGSGGRAMPAEVAAGSLSDTLITSTTTAAMFAMQARITLAPGQSHTLVYAYGYGDMGTIPALVRRLAASAPTALAQSEAAWSQTLPVLSFPQDQWLAREMAWNYYYLRSGYTTEDVWRAAVPSQGSVYQYDWGMNIAYRDPLQYVLPSIYVAPWLARSALRFALEAQPQSGFIPYGFISGGVAITTTTADDLDLWLLWTTSEYVLATRDFNFLGTTVPFYGAATPTTVYSHLKTAYQHQLTAVGFGPHGEFNMLSGDWADGEGASGATESTPTTAQAAWVFPFFAQIADAVGDHAFAAQVRAEGQALAGVVRAQWTGRWFNRGYRGATPYGSDSLYLNTQPWAILSGAATVTQTLITAANINTLLSQPSPIGAVSESTSQGASGEGGNGIGSTGGTWYALNGLAVWALASAAPQLAYREYRDNTHATYAQTYPTNWYGVLSGPDSYDSYEAGPQAGQALFMDYPVQNLHAHAWPLYDTLKLSGIQPTLSGYTIDPHWPFTQFTCNTALIGTTYTSQGVTGYLRPVDSGLLRMRVRVPATMSGPMSVSVNGSAVAAVQSGSFALWTMPVVGGQTTTWSIQPASSPHSP